MRDSAVDESQRTNNEVESNDNIDSVVGSKPHNPVSEVVIIHGTAVIEDSPFNTFVNEELDSLVRFITSKEHLQNNIKNIEYTHLSTREFRHGKFKHIVALKIHVKTSSLWESPRSYLWRHIGNDTWTRGNGSTINVTKIHQKFN